MISALKNLAIQKALESNWEEACKLNQQLLEESPTDIDTLNRLAFSFIKLGNFKKARETYKKALELDATNPITLKNLKKIEAMPKHMQDSTISKVKPKSIRIDELFIEEAGRTKIVELKNITDKSTLSLLQSGDCAQLVIKRSKIFVQTDLKKYIGMLPDNVGSRLIPFMKGGNEYEVFLKAVSDKSVTVFIKETKRSKRFKFQPSFTLSISPTLHKDELDGAE